jgi:hypothetical protein
VVTWHLPRLRLTANGTLYGKALAGSIPVLTTKIKIMESKLLWWGYKHTSGTYQAKRYFDRLDIQEAMESPFCKTVVGPFEAENRDKALEIVEQKTN